MPALPKIVPVVREIRRPGLSAVGHLYYGNEGAHEVLPHLKRGSVNCIVVGPPPYATRLYANKPIRWNFPGGGRTALGQEDSVTEYVNCLCYLVDDLKPLLSPDGSLWLHVFDLTNTGQKGFEPFMNAKRKGIPKGTLFNLPSYLITALCGFGWAVRQFNLVKFDTRPDSTERQPGFAVSTLLWLWPAESKPYYDHVSMQVMSQSKRGAKGNLKHKQPPERGNYGTTNIPWDRKAVREYRGSDMTFASLEDLRDNALAIAREATRILEGRGFRDGTCHRGNGFLLDSEGYPVLGVYSVKGSGFVVDGWYPRVVNDIILATSSEKGVCPNCFTQWVREGDGDTWIPSCKCPDRGPVPATVMDPCAGRASAGGVALALGRSFIGIEPQQDLIDDAEFVLRRCRNPNKDREQLQCDLQQAREEDREEQDFWELMGK